MRLRRALVVSQVAASLVLVVGAALFVRSFRNLVTQPLGFDREGVLVVDAGLPPPQPPPEVARALNRQLLERVRAVRGVRGAAYTNVIPLSGNTTSNTVWLAGATKSDGRAMLFSRISSGYFATLSMPLLSGRDIAPADTATSPRVAVVNETFARRFTPGHSPVGKRFWREATPTSPELDYEIVGVVRDAKYGRLREEPSPVAFLAISQPSGSTDGGTLLVRGAAPAETLVPAVRQALMELNGNLRFTFRVLDTQIRESALRDQIMATLSGLFGVLAAMIAAIGLHGAVACMVERRRREIGIRLALGADRGTIVRSVLGDTGALVATGLALGLVASLMLTRTVRTLLFGLRPDDGMTLAASAIGLLAMALVASAVPAYRAARVDPIVTLRDE
jgi:putative ABC transport system permease protein